MNELSLLLYNKEEQKDDELLIHALFVLLECFEAKRDESRDASFFLSIFCAGATMQTMDDLIYWY